MGNNLFGVNLSGIIATNLGPLLLPCTLSKVVGTQRDPNALTAGVQPQSVDYPCRGMIEDYNEHQVALTLIETGDKKVLILGDTLPINIIPNPGDLITVEGTQYTCIRVQRDPAAATYTCQVRGV